MYANVNGIKLFFDVEGKQFVPDGPILREKPVCFLFHGGPGGDHSHYLPEFLCMSRFAQLVFIDHRASGRSGPAPLDTCSLNQNIEDAEALRQYLGLDKIFILGQSYGGMVAQGYALKYQQNLHGMILTSTAPSHRIFDTVQEQLEKRATPEQKAIAEASLNGNMTKDEDYRTYLKACASLYHYKYDKKACDEGLDRGIFNMSIVNNAFAGELATFDYVPQLHTIKVPTLVVAGEEDFITPPVHSEEIVKEIKQAQYLLLPEAAHEVGADQPEKLFPVIEKFMMDNFKK